MDSNPEHQFNDIEVLKKMEDEHLRLQRQVRMIQTDRLHRTMGVHPQFRRQDELLRALKAEYSSLCKDVKIARSGAHKKKDKKMKHDLKKALLLRIQTEQECEAGITVSGQIDELVLRHYKDNGMWRELATNTRGQLEDRRIQSEQRLVSTENKLEAAQLRFNAVQYANNKIREEIEHMLKDRALFNQSWHKMLSALNKGKKFLGDLFESSTLAYDQRDEWVTKLKSVQEKGKIDQMLQIQEMRDLVKAYNHEMKLYHFLAAKGLTRINEKQEQKEEKDKKKEEEETQSKLQYHLNLLEEICEYTGKECSKDIRTQFIRREQKNDSIYKLLTEYCAENEVLRREVKKLRRDACDRRDWNEKAEETRQNKLSELRNALEKQTTRTERLRTKNEDAKNFVKETVNKIYDIFNMLDCSLEPFQNLLGDKQPSEHTLKLSLRLITEKIEEYRELVYYYERFIQKKTDKASSSSRLKKYTVRAEPLSQFMPMTINMLVPADPCPACVETRWLSRISDGLQSPLDPAQTLEALAELSSDPAYLRSDRIHTLAECKVPRSRALLARRYMKY